MHRTHKHAFSNTIKIVIRKVIIPFMDHSLVMMKGLEKLSEDSSCVCRVSKSLSIVKNSENIRSINQGTLDMVKQ